jgi:DNA mismatch endonuclease (patch repair protein)
MTRRSGARARGLGASTDPHAGAVRSRMMRAVRSRGSAPERQVGAELGRLRLRFRAHDRVLPGTQDFVLPAHRIAIFVHGCFWHAHGRCRLFRMPRTRVDYWAQKLECNRARDSRVRRQIRHLGWRVLTIWECQLASHRMSLDHRLRRQLSKLAVRRGSAVPIRGMETRAAYHGRAS